MRTFEWDDGLCEYCELDRPTTLDELESGEFCQCDQFDCANCQDSGLVCGTCLTAWCVDSIHNMTCNCEKGQELEREREAMLEEHKVIERGLATARKNWLRTAGWKVVQMGVPPFIQAVRKEAE